MGETKKAAALKYRSNEDQAPRIIAKGKGYVAEAILNKGEESHIPVYKDKKLADQLEHLDIGTEIPPYLYDVVAQVLIFVAKMDQGAKGRK